MNETLQRVRIHLFDRQLLALLVIVCLLCAGGWLTYTAHVDPGERTEQRVTNSWTMTGSVSHGASVVEPNPIYGADDSDGAGDETNGGEADGDRANETDGDDESADDTDSGSVTDSGDVITTVTDEPLYYTDVSPTAHGDVAVDYDADRHDDVAITIELERVSRAVGDDTVYWAESEPLARVERTAVDPGEDVVTTFELNVSHLEDRIDEIEDGLGASPGETETYVDVSVTLDGTVEGESVSVTRTSRIDLALEDSTYSIEVNDPLEETFTDTETVRVSQSHGSLRTVGGPVLVGAGLVGAGALVAVRRHGPPSESERTWLAYRADRDEFADVIVRVRIDRSTGMGEQSVVHVPTLAELARFAIDVDAAVLEETGRDRYVVQHEGETYIYEPPARPGRSPDGDENDD